MRRTLCYQLSKGGGISEFEATFHNKIERQEFLKMLAKKRVEKFFLSLINR